MTSLLDLPLELRVQIYKYCLVVGRVYPYASKDLIQSLGGKFVRPATQLLRVSTQIRHEARSLLYGQNTFVLSDHKDIAIFRRQTSGLHSIAKDKTRKRNKAKPASPSSDNGPPRVEQSPDALSLIRRVDISFSKFDVEDWEYEIYIDKHADSLKAYLRSGFMARPIEDAGDELHGNLGMALCQLWSKSCEVLEPMKLDVLDIDLSMAIDLPGCCDMGKEVAEMIRLPRGLPEHLNVKVAGIQRANILKKIVIQGYQVEFDPCAYEGSSSSE